MSAALLIAAAGCTSGGGDQSEPSTSTAGSPTSTTVAEATTSTTEPDLTTLDSGLEAEEAAIAVLERQREVFRACVVLPSECDPVVFVETASGAVLERLVSRVRVLQDAGLEVKGATDVSGLVETVVETEALGPQANNFRVRGCEVDNGVTIDPGAGPGGEDVIVDDSITSIVSDSYIRKEDDGIWRMYEAQIVGTTDGAEGCK